MGEVNFELALKFTTIECAICQMPFAVSPFFKSEMQTTHKTFYCPRGHSIWYLEKSDEEKLRAELKQARAEIVYQSDRVQSKAAALKMAEYQLRAEKGAKTKLKKRIAAGVCPCCTRSFQNLQRHIAHQHPDYTESDK